MEDKMCQMSVVMEDDKGKEEMIMENVTRLQVSGDAIEVVAFFEEPRKVQAASIQSIDFLGGKVVLKKSAA
jgi:predicted RNA-binding protein